MRKLLKKDIPWIWECEHQQEFINIKGILQNPLSLKPFNPRWLTCLYTDFSKYGFGFMLTQEDPNDPTKKHIVY